ncbi:MAG: glycerol-3-phosphate dehydrogenase subunit GlpB [Thermoleophilia bacterium]
MSGPRVVVVGAGLAGLVAATRLVGEGVACTVLAKGLGGLTLSPGTIDVLGYAPETVVEDLPGAVAAFVADNPDHPYAQLAGGAIGRGIDVLRDAVQPVRLEGDGQRNMLLPTIIGGVRPTASAPGGLAAGALAAGARYLLVGFDAMRDAPMGLCAANLPLSAAARGIPDVTARAVTLRSSPRPGEADVGTVTFARAFDDPVFMARVAAELRPMVRPGELVAFPAVLGMDRSLEVIAELAARVGAPVCEIATIPPSVPGMRMDAALRRRLAQAGCPVVIGPTVLDLERDAGGRVTTMRVEAGGGVDPRAVDAVILATGGLASGAIHVDSRGTMRETVADLPLAHDPGVDARFDASASGRHPGMAIGVAVDGDMRPLAADGTPWAPNVFVAGALIGGALPWREGSGEGICLASAVTAADAAARAVNVVASGGGAA